MDGFEMEFPGLDLDAVDPTEETGVDNAGVDGTEPEIQVPDDQEADTTADAQDGEEEGEQEPTDGRKLPDEVRKALKALRDSSPENAKAARALNDVYGREQAYKQAFATVADAKAAQGTIATIDSFGGLEAVQNTIAEIEEIDQLLQAGDVKAVEKIFEVSGEGFGKIAPAMLDKLQASNPEAYAAAIRPHLVSAIGQSGLTEAFGEVIRAYQFAQTAGATPEFKGKFEKDAQEGLQKIHQFLQNLGKAPVTQPTAAAAGAPDKLTAREQAIATKEAAHFNTEVGSLANTQMTASLSKAMAPHLKGVKLDNTGRAEFTQSIYDEIAKLAKEDKVYQTQKDTLYKSKTKDAGKIAKLMSTKFDAVVTQATKTVAARPQWKALLSAKGGVTKPAAGAAPAVGAPGKPTLVKELPNRNDVDWNKTTYDMMIRGVRVLKSGKVVKLDR